MQIRGNIQRTKAVVQAELQWLKAPKRAERTACTQEDGACMLKNIFPDLRGKIVGGNPVRYLPEEKPLRRRAKGDPSLEQIMQIRTQCWTERARQHTNLHRFFSNSETKKYTISELKLLRYSQGVLPVPVRHHGSKSERSNLTE